MNSIKEHAKESNLEVCGFVLVENGDLRTEPAKNISMYEEDIFEIHPLETFKYIQSGKLAAIYHTHPECNEDESQFDLFNCENSCIPYLIYSKKTDKFNLIIPKTPHVKKEYIEILKKYYD
jgi:proteasome lid subunit RPN8/RPN11